MPVQLPAIHRQQRIMINADVLCRVAIIPVTLTAIAIGGAYLERLSMKGKEDLTVTPMVVTFSALYAIALLILMRR